MQKIHFVRFNWHFEKKKKKKKAPENHGHFSLANTVLTKFGNLFGSFLEGTGDRFDAVTDSTFCHSSIVNN